MAAPPALGDVEAENPFRMPREMEYFWHPGVDLRSAPNAYANHDLKIWEKATAASRYNSTRKVTEEDMPMAPVPAKLQNKLDLAKRRAIEEERPDETFLTTLANKPAVGLVAPLKQVEKDSRNIRGYIEKKREVFLAQMASDVKKAETIRLDEKARMKEEALAKSQQMLDEDAKKFEEYLQQKMKEDQDCKKEAEKHSKLKQDKLQKIKQIRAQISGVESDISKFREVREECARYKDFLGKLTPDEWKESQAKLKRLRKSDRRQAWIADRMAVVNEHLAEEEKKMEQSAASEAATEAEARSKRRAKKRQEEEEELAKKERERALRQKKLQRKREEEEKRISGEYVEVSSEEEHELCFREPQQLVDTFTELEEKNLFLIHSSQETEQQLDELRHMHENTKKEMGAKVKQLQEMVRVQEGLITQEQAHTVELNKRYSEKAGTRKQEFDRRMNKLKESVHHLYARVCPQSAADTDRGPLQMLAEIEAEVEKLITGLDEYHQQDGKLIMQLEQEKEKARRERVKEMTKREKELKDEKRLGASLARSQAPVFRKAGKQVMYRSPPLRTEQKVVEDNRDEEAMVEEHDRFGVHIDRKSNMPQTEPPAKQEPSRTRGARRGTGSCSPTTHSLQPASPGAAQACLGSPNTVSFAGEETLLP
jgi:hypothetical protein